MLDFDLFQDVSTARSEEMFFEYCMRKRLGDYWTNEEYLYKAKIRTKLQGSFRGFVISMQNFGEAAGIARNRVRDFLESRMEIERIINGEIEVYTNVQMIVKDGKVVSLGAEKFEPATGGFVSSQTLSDVACMGLMGFEGSVQQHELQAKIQKISWATGLTPEEIAARAEEYSQGSARSFDDALDAMLQYGIAF